MNRSAFDDLICQGGQVPLVGWTLIEVGGRDRERFLHSQLTSDVAGLAQGASQMTALLDRTGRLQVFGFLMTRLLGVDPSSVMAHTNLLLYYNQLGRIEDAEREAAEAMRARMRHDTVDRDHESSVRQDSDAAAVDRPRRAEIFRRVLELDPDDVIGNFGLGELLVEEGRWDDAVGHLERALGADPRYSAAMLGLGRAHEGAGDYAAAIRVYRGGIDVAAARGDLATANKMQERLAALEGGIK